MTTTSYKFSIIYILGVGRCSIIADNCATHLLIINGKLLLAPHILSFSHRSQSGSGLLREHLIYALRCSAQRCNALTLRALQARLRDREESYERGLGDEQILKDHSGSRKWEHSLQHHEPQSPYSVVAESEEPGQQGLLHQLYSAALDRSHQWPSTRASPRADTPQRPAHRWR